MFALATGAANAQTVPTSDFTLPEACQPTALHGDTKEARHAALRTCIEALRAELGDDHPGLGDAVSALAHSHGHGHHQDGSSDPEATATPPATPAESEPATNGQHHSPHHTSQDHQDN
jgi:hypothetical protein